MEPQKVESNVNIIQSPEKIENATSNPIQNSNPATPRTK